MEKYINKRNIIAVNVVIALVGRIYLGAVQADKRIEVPVWVDRFWNIGFSGIIGSLVIALFNFIIDKK